MVRYNSVKAFQQADGSVVIEPITTFNFSEAHVIGNLKAVFEYNMYLNENTGEWYGDVIDYDGWRDLNDDEVNDIVNRYRLEEKI